MNILVSGSLAYDQIMTYPGEFKDHILLEEAGDLNVSFLVNDLSRQFGGTAGNIAYNLSLLEEQSTIIASLGKDCDQYLEWLTSHGIGTEHLTINQSAYTATAYISTDIKGNQIAFFHPGSMEHPSSFAFPTLNPNETFAIISPGNMVDMSTFTAHYKRSRVPYIFDPGQQIPAIPEVDLLECIEGSFLLICNAYEFEMIKAKTHQSTDTLLKLTKQIVVTQGESGSMLIDNEGTHAIDVIPVESAIDPTGAGDAYRAGLLKGLTSGKSTINSAKMGAACASFCVEATGTQNHYFTLQDFNNRTQT